MKYSLLLCSFVLSFFAFAQSPIPENIKPPSWSISKTNLPNIKGFKLPEINLKNLIEEDKTNDLDKSKPWRFGVEHYVDHDIMDYGSWTMLDNGDKIWRMAYVSEGALTLNFVFDSFNLPNGAKLYVYNDEKSDLLRPFSHHNNNPEQVLGTWTVNGNKAWLEYYEPANAQGDLKLTLGSVVHGYRTADSYQKALGDSGDCNHDVDCDITPNGPDPFGINTVKENVKKAAGMLVTGNTGFCSGTLINNTNNDGTPYFLTANHCGGGEGTWAFRFNWRSPNVSCATTQPSAGGSFDQTVSGAILRANSSESDMELVEITDASFFNNNPDVVWAGWNRSTTEVPQLSFGIHHPSGDIQKVCRDDQGGTRVTQGFNGNSSAQFWRIADWDLGVTEPGSSGSALFNETGKIIGMLSAGAAACNGTNDNNQFDIYGRFGVGWDFGNSASSRLRDWLDPSGSNPIELDQFPPIETFENDARVTLGTTSVIEICNEDFDPAISIINSGTSTLTSATISYSLDGEPEQIINWTGSLATNQAAIEDIPAYSNLAPGPHSFVVIISAPNGVTDENTSNDVFTSNFTVSPEFDTSVVVFNLSTDDYGFETTWTLTDSNGNVVEDGPNTPYDDGSDFQETINLPSVNECYTFTIFDSFGDGICCDYGTGSYNLEDENGNVILSGGAFGESESITFNASDGLSVGGNDFSQNFNVFPNPANNELNVSVRNIKNVSYSLYSLVGQQIKSGTLNEQGLNKIDLSSISNGIYLISIESDGQSFTQKIVKK